MVYNRKKAGLTLVETALLLSIIGIVLAVMIPTFLRTVRTSKVAEASTKLSTLYQLTAAYYTTSHPTEKGIRIHCLPPSAGPTPEEPSDKPVQVDFAAQDTPGSATWRAFDFHPQEPIRFRYSYLTQKEGCSITSSETEPLITFRAEGDLDSDGETSLFERSANIDDEGDLVIDKLLLVRDRME